MNGSKKIVSFLYLFISSLIFSSFLMSENQPHRLKIGLLIMATGKYTVFLKPLFESADKYFLSQHNVTYFVFTDGDIPCSDHAVKIFQQRLGWPYDTLMRFSVYNAARDLFSDFDYLYCCDADMLFVDTVGDEILGARIATEHPGFAPRSIGGSRKRGTYEQHRFSTAYIDDNEGEYYFAGGFYGGAKQEILQLFETVVKNIETDLKKDYIAIWHDESHLNRYFIDNKPTMILNPSYCYPEKWRLPYPKKLLALDKEHSEFQVK